MSNFSYLRIDRKLVYLLVFIDLFSRVVVGWDLSDSLEHHSTIQALNKSILERNPPKGLIIRRDQGIQFASTDFRKKLKDKKFIQSMSSRGNFWDNAIAESLFHSQKTQRVHHMKYKTQ